MLPAIIEIHQALMRSGYTEDGADELVTRLMQEEAFDFVECIKMYKEEKNDNKRLN